MSRLFTIFAFTVLIFSCSIQNNGDVKALTDITSQEQAQLEALKPQAEDIVIEVFGNKDALSDGKQLDLQKFSLYKEKIIALLKSHFGDDYSKFIIDTDLPAKSVQSPGVSNGSSLTSITSISKSDVYSYTQRINIGGCKYVHYKYYPTGFWEIDEIHSYYLNVNIHTYSDILVKFYYVNQWTTDDATFYYWFDDHYTFSTNPLEIDDMILSANNGGIWNRGPVEKYSCSDLILIVPSASLVSVSTLKDSNLKQNPIQASFWW
jgi:hypothetical protein